MHSKIGVRKLLKLALFFKTKYKVISIKPTCENNWLSVLLGFLRLLLLFQGGQHVSDVQLHRNLALFPRGFLAFLEIR